MLIISQDQLKTVNADTGNIYCNGKTIFYSVDGNEMVPLGFYSDENEAQKVMKEITKGIELQTFQMPPCKKKHDHKMSKEEIEKEIENFPDPTGLPNPYPDPTK